MNIHCMDQEYHHFQNHLLTWLRPVGAEMFGVLASEDVILFTLVM